MLAALAREKVNLRALTVMDQHEQGVLRFLADDTARAVRVLKGLGVACFEADVLAVELRNQPGALAHVCEILASEHVNIDYAYCSSGGRNGKVVGIFKVSNNEKAMRVLGSSPNASARRLEKRVVRDRQIYAPKGNSARR